ncbi:unnamed protein product [Ilex paraguariensis]|uniref:Uncharacterized protein n=1 Tax=Ilex paraguariensis TaxID=185542 RepID=A0ABC8UY52_9AQUA
MEKALETQPKTQIQSENTLLDPKTPPQNPLSKHNSQTSANDPPKTGSPYRLKVPKAFKYPERYTSPTDHMMSPVSKGLLARSRKPAAHLPPSRNQESTQDSGFAFSGGWSFLSVKY